MRKLSYATLVLASTAPWCGFSAIAADSESAANTGLTASDQYYINSRAGGDAGQYVDQFPGANIPSAESQMPSDDWSAMSGSSLPPSASARTPVRTTTKTPDWLSNPTGPLFK